MLAPRFAIESPYFDPRDPTPLIVFFPHSTELCGEANHHSSKASRGEELETEILHKWFSTPYFTALPRAGASMSPSQLRITWI